ncbi:MAG: GGDEF domain-containing protein [Rhodococcus sp. (in: high G+C Gram-positive bacteria)]|uniref:GGDEF domain-containing protein n=1 Tax=Rhodococcus sp. TaxID=1831 RepID=UPI002ADA0C63|nr:GGDEF domain-containing protein [Rhodococcus sp. (in: high G+C Gram-positive bacteria)]
MRWWWRRPFEYRWVHGYVESRAWLSIDGALTATGYTMFAVLGVTLLTVTTPSGPRAAVAALAAGWFAVLAVWWWMRRSWPGESTSLAMVISTEIGLAALLIASPSPTAALALLSLYVLPGMYLVFIHGPRALVAHHLWVLGVVTSTGVYVLTFTDVDTSTAVLLLIVELFVCCGGLIASHIAVTFIRSDARDSLTDALTGLLNRRGLHRMVTDLFVTEKPCRAVTVTIIDLDNFKHYNDSHGHREGDARLMTVASILDDIYGEYPGALARIGGDEFISVTDLDSVSAAALADRALSATTAIDLPTGLSISIGVHTTSNHRPHTTHDDIDEAATLADAAMYRAKDRGGNAVVVTHE